MIYNNYMKDKKFCVTFAGAVGSSKTPIAYHLSYTYGIPIFNNDTIRTEVKEDLLEFDEDEYEKRRTFRAKSILESGKSFIYDASIDRRWAELKDYLEEYDYTWFIVSLDLSKELLTRIYKAKGYDALERLDDLLEDHQEFLNDYGDQVDIHIDDSDFPDRLKISGGAFGDWLENNKFNLNKY